MKQQVQAALSESGRCLDDSDPVPRYREPMGPIDCSGELVFASKPTGPGCSTSGKSAMVHMLQFSSRRPDLEASLGDRLETCCSTVVSNWEVLALVLPRLPAPSHGPRIDPLEFPVQPLACLLRRVRGPIPEAIVAVEWDDCLASSSR